MNSSKSIDGGGEQEGAEASGGESSVGEVQLPLLVWIHTEDPEGAPVERICVERAHYFGPIISSWQILGSEELFLHQEEADLWFCRY